MSDPADEIMSATYRALCEHGYADLTMQDIADETDKSKAALHYHYDSKRDLLLSFLEFLYGEFTDRVDAPAAGQSGGTASDADAGTRLVAFVDRVLDPPEEDPERRQGFKTAMLELKAQAPYDEGIREHLQRFDEFVFQRVRRLVVAGIEDGSVRPVDPDDAARFVATALDGAHTKQVAVGQDPECTRRVLHSYVERHLLTDETGREAVAE